MDQPNGSTQTASVSNPPAAAEPTPAELKAKIAELEKQSEGRLRDLQSERAKRQEYEAKLNQPPASSPAPQQDVTQDELGKVINPYIEARVKPLQEKLKVAESIANQTLSDKALDYLAAKTGKTKEAVVNDKDLDAKMSAVIKRYGLTGNVYDLAQKAWEIVELENLKAQDAERRRAAEASGSSSIPSGTHVPERVGSKEFDEEAWSAMPLHEYEQLASKGSFHQSKDGKIVFTPHSK